MLDRARCGGGRCLSTCCCRCGGGRLRAQFVLLCLLAGTMTCGFEVLRRYHVLCLKSQVNANIDNLCLEYASGRVSGLLCPELCVSRTMTAHSCHHMHYEKDDVFETTYKGRPVIMKSVRYGNNSLDSDKRSARVLIAGEMVAPDEEVFADKVAQYLKSKFGVRVGSDSSDRMEAVRSFWQGRDASTGADRDSLWNVLQSREYVALNLFRQTGVVPGVVGTCGNFYAVEKLVPLKFPPLAEFRPSPSEWRARLETALELINFARKLDSTGLVSSSGVDASSAAPLVYCDVKSVHFGKSERGGSILVADADALMLRRRADALIGRGNACKSHAECDLQDCRGFCSSSNAECLYQMTNNNLQIICEKLFLGWYRELHVTFPGLLASRAASEELRAAAAECANPRGNADERRFFANRTVEDRLVAAIRSELDSIKYV